MASIDPIDSPLKFSGRKQSISKQYRAKEGLTPLEYPGDGEGGGV